MLGLVWAASISFVIVGFSWSYHIPGGRMVVCGVVLVVSCVLCGVVLVVCWCV